MPFGEIVCWLISTWKVMSTFGRGPVKQALHASKQMERSAHVSCHIDASVSAGATACWRNAFVLAPAVSVHEFVLIGAHRQRYGQLINTVPVRVQHLSGGWIPVASKTSDSLKVTGHMDTSLERPFPDPCPLGR